jgi:predicted ATPase
MKRIVLTGGPGAGKTVITTAIAVADPRFLRVPEAATHVYDLLQTRWDRLDVPGRRDVQRQIFHHQVEQENRLAAMNPSRLILLDRGTIDGAAYWPEGPDAYWTDLHTTLAEQLNRYDAVIWLQTGAALGHYDGDASNACRFEDDAAAIESGLLLGKLWGGHPCIKHVGAYPTIEEKIEAVRSVIGEMIGASI